MKNPTLIYIHGQYGSPDEAEHYRPLFPGCGALVPHPGADEVPGRVDSKGSAEKKHPAAMAECNNKQGNKQGLTPLTAR